MPDKDDDKSTNEYEYIKIEGRDIYFYSEVDNESVLELNIALTKLDKELRKSFIDLGIDQTPEIRIFIHSPGGDLHAGMSAMDRISSMKCDTVTIADGYCCSAAAIMLLGGKRRAITPNSYILIHQMSTEFWGKFEEIKDEMENCRMFQEHIKEICTARTSLPEKKLKRLMKHDLYLTAAKCIKYGVVDQIHE
jgi:ATP-dependent Clp endopeptidase proteolytic subunit ClpP